MGKKRRRHFDKWKISGTTPKKRLNLEENTTVNRSNMFHLVSLVLVATLLTPQIQGNLETYPTANREMERRRDNFRLPVDMPFDPKFWPTRGRRSQFRLGPNCSDLADVILALASQDCLRFLDLEPFETTNASNPDKFSNKRQKKSRFAELPDFLWSNGKNRLWKPDLSYQEKEKKENVFWVTRGKRSFS